MKLVDLYEAYKPPKLKPWMLQTKPEIEQWLKDNNYEGLVSRELEVHLTDMSLRNRYSSDKTRGLVDYKGKKVLPVQFYMAGTVDLSLQLNSLIGLPFLITKSLRLTEVNLTSLEGMPKQILSKDAFDFQISITNEGILKSFKWLPDELISFQYSGKFKSLEGLPSSITKLQISYLTDLKLLAEKCPDLQEAYFTKIDVSQFKPLQLFKFKKLKFVLFTPKDPWEAVPEDVSKAGNIVNKHLKDRDMLACHEELVDNDLEDFAKL